MCWVAKRDPSIFEKFFSHFGGSLFGHPWIFSRSREDTIHENPMEPFFITYNLST
jgi:hypothetical protein